MKPSTRIPRKKKKMALYEVLSKGMSNSRRRLELGGPPIGVSQVQRTQAKPRAIQLNHGRFEVSLRYDVAIVLGLLLILSLMGAYRLGEYSSIKENVTTQDESIVMTAPETVSNTATPVTEPERTAVEEESSGDNWIVIATNQSEGQLAPVQQYFEGYGIETQIRKVAGVYILHTKRTFGNPNRAGSDGEKMRRQIIEIGEDYEPPSGYRSFDFTTAYGMKKLN
jgi:hypothetical protein